MKNKKWLSLLVLPMLLVGCGEEKTSEAPKPTEGGKETTVDTESPKPTEDPKTEQPAGADPFVMEAEYTDLTGKIGAGYSGSALGLDMIQADQNGAAQASNGYWVGYLYVNNLSLEFNFTSDKAIENVDLTLRLSCEIKDITLTSDNYKIFVNDEELVDYGTITLAGASNSDSSGYVRPFTDYKCRKKINVKQGENSIVLKTSNSEGMGGTMYATAPMVDCIKLGTLDGAILDYGALESNLSVFE